MEAIEEEIALLLRDGATDEELSRSKELLKTGVVMSFESSASRMSFNAREFMRRGFVRAMDDLLEAVDRVDHALLHEVVQETFDESRRSLSVVGRLRSGGYR